MIQTLERMFEIMKAWPEARQDDAAAVLEAMAAQDGDQPYALSSEERLAIEASRAQARCGEFVSDAEVAAVLRKHGL